MRRAKMLKRTRRRMPVSVRIVTAMILVIMAWGIRAIALLVFKGTLMSKENAKV